MNCQEELTIQEIDALKRSTRFQSSESGRNYSLQGFIDEMRCFGVNIAQHESVARALRAYDTRDVVEPNDNRPGSSGPPWEFGCVSSQAGDDDLIVHVAFSEAVHIKNIVIGTGGGRLTTSPQVLKTFVNHPDGVSFDDIDRGRVPVSQEFALAQSPTGATGAVAYGTHLQKFKYVHAVTLFFSQSLGGHQSTVYFVGFTGESRIPKGDPTLPRQVAAHYDVPQPMARSENPPAAI